MTSPLRIDPDTLDFELPESLIAQTPLAERDQARLVVIDRGAGTIGHRRFADLTQLLKPTDALVINTARVNAAKLVGKKATGGKAEVIFVGPAPHGLWRALVRPHMKPGAEIQFDAGASAVLVDRTDTGDWLVRVSEDPTTLMERAGRLPLPPYIKREADDARDAADREYYQTVYAAAPGSIAAPTAGLHFSAPLLAALEAGGIPIIRIVLHVGWGTFKPIASTVDAHRMLGERYELSRGSVEALRRAESEGRRLVAVGTTSTRVLESLPDALDPAGMTGESDLFIRPGHRFRRVGALITNLHVPRSTPVALTAAFAGLPLVERAYEEAIARQYRFFSYGDAMLVL